MGMVISPFQTGAGYASAQLAYERRTAEMGTFSTGSTKLAQAMSLVALGDSQACDGFADPPGQMLMSQDLNLSQALQQEASQSYLQRDLQGRMTKRIAVDIPPVPSQELLLSQTDLATPVEQQFHMSYIPVGQEAANTSTTDEGSRSPAPSLLRFQKRPRPILHLTADCDSDCNSQLSGSQSRSHGEPSSGSKATSNFTAATLSGAPSGGGAAGGGGSRRPPIPRARHRQEPPVIRNPYINPLKSDAVMSQGSEDHIYQSSQHQAIEQPSKTSRLSWDFKIEGELGHGHYSTVYKAVHRSSGKAYAVKRNKRPIQSMADKNMWLTEIQALALLEGHPNIVTFHDNWFEPAYDSHVGGENVLIKMELCGESLGAVLARKVPLMESELLLIMRHVASGLKHVHDMGLAHMDIKPDNIYKAQKPGVGNQEVAYKLGDFGLATPKDGSGRFMEGDTRYMAPELYRPELHNKLEKADMFALGAMLYELATASPLPQGGDRYQDIRAGKLVMIPHISMKLQALIKKLMVSDPKVRPSADDLLRTPLMSTQPLKLTRSSSSMLQQSQSQSK